MRTGAVTVELRGLRAQQQRQRIIRSMTARGIGVETRGGGIAVANREQAVGNGMPAAGMTPLAPPA